MSAECPSRAVPTSATLGHMLTNLERRANALSSAFDRASCRAQAIDRRFSEHVDRAKKEETFVACLSLLHDHDTRLAALFLQQMRTTFREVAAFVKQSAACEESQSEDRSPVLPGGHGAADPRHSGIYRDIWRRFRLDEHQVYLLSIVGEMLDSKSSRASRRKITGVLTPSLREMDTITSLMDDVVTEVDTLSFVKNIMRRAPLAENATLLD